jgi:hypothetical protein
VDASSLVTQYARTDTRKFSFGVRVVEPWNGLDSDTRNCRTNKAFKNKLKARPGLIYGTWSQLRQRNELTQVKMVKKIINTPVIRWKATRRQ